MAIANFIFGIGIFLFAMRELEAGIRLASGKKLKEWVVSSTNTPLNSAICGVLVTAILQSSSMVSLIVLALVSASVMPLFNGIGVVIGANLGTTMTGWVVTVIGFKMNLLAFIVPLLGIGAILQLLHSRSDKLPSLGRAIVGLALLIFGLDLMKGSVSGLAEFVDFTAFEDAPAWFYLLVGLALAAVMQSSSAVMIITLSLLSSQLIPLTSAAAVVIGADLGTTSTTILGSLGESRLKKQLAFAHVFFNVSVDIAAFFILLPLFPTILATLGISDALFGLVFFHSTFNLLGVLFYLPLLKFYTRSIQWLIPLRNQTRRHFFEVPIEVTDVAIESLEAALAQLTKEAFKINLSELKIDIVAPSLPDFSPELSAEEFMQSYQELKEFEGEMIAYANRLMAQGISTEQADQVRKFLQIARALVYAAKTLKDVYADLNYLHSIEGDASTQGFIDQHNRYLTHFYKKVIPILLPQNENLSNSVTPNSVISSSKLQRSQIKEAYKELMALNDVHRRESNDLISQIDHNDSASPAHLSTLMNLSHELHHYSRSMLNAVNLRLDL